MLLTFTEDTLLNLTARGQTCTIYCVQAPSRPISVTKDSCNSNHIFLVLYFNKCHKSVFKNHSRHKLRI